jgi:hypothetical protein
MHIALCSACGVQHYSPTKQLLWACCSCRDAVCVRSTLLPGGRHLSLWLLLFRLLLRLFVFSGRLLLLLLLPSVFALGVGR